MELTPGVNLTVIPTSKFKTISIKVVFKTALTKENITSRSLLSRVLERNSKDYPTQSELSKALSNLYGASFGTSVSRKGHIHTLSLNMRIVNDQFISHDQLTNEAIDFMKSVLLKPNISGDAFDSKTFNREKLNLKDDIESIYDNKRLYAKRAMLKEYFTDEKQSISLNGDLETLNLITSESLYDTYKKMIEEDEIDIIILGDIEEEEAKNLFQSFNFKERLSNSSNIFYENGTTEYTRKEEVQDVQQAKLNLAYDTGVYHLDENFFAMQVFNGIFGGFPSSKLFLNVREKESLAYYASSQLDSIHGSLYVQTGIDKNEADRVIDLITVQLNDIIAGDFSDETIRQTKEMLKNSLRQSEDSPGQMIRSAYTRVLADNNMTIDERIEQVDAVTREDIIDAAKRLSLKTIFLLKGE